MAITRAGKALLLFVVAALVYRMTILVMEGALRRDWTARTRFPPVRHLISGARAAAAGVAVFRRDWRCYGTGSTDGRITMSDEMGTFRVDIEIENPSRPGPRVPLGGVLVDTGAELSWIPSGILEALGIGRRKEMWFRQADGTILARWTGSAWLYAGGTSATDDVVFGQPGDMVLLGARSLEGLNLRIDPVSKTLVDAGPAPAAAAP
jgi:hypothetical protein